MRCMAIVRPFAMPSPLWGLVFYGSRVFEPDLAAPSGTEVACSSLIWRRHPALIVPAWSGRGRKPTKHRLKTASNRPYRVDELLWRLPKTAWVRGTVKEGSKGPIVCDFAFVRVTEARQGLPGWRIWLVIRRNVADPQVVKFYFSNAPETVDPVELVRISGMRW